MIGNLLKKLNNKTPNSIKRILAKPIRLKVIKNKEFLKQYMLISDYDKYPEKKKEEIHLELLKDTLIYAYENTNYYKMQFDKFNFSPYDFNNIDELKRLPTITKNEVIENYDDLISKEDIDHYVAYTGGSTGKPLKILLDTKSIYKEKAFVYKYWERFGYNYKTSKMVTFRGLEFNNSIYKLNPIDNQLILNPFKLNYNNVDEYVKLIDKYKAEFIHGYCSAIYNFCKLVDSKGLKLSGNIKGVCFISENVDEEQKKFIEKILGCKSNIFYGHSERIVFAEHYNESYHFNDLYTHVDFINCDEEDTYKMACTGFLSRKMPLIRYVPDDVAVIKNKNIFINGHWDKDVLIGKNNEVISIASINFHTPVFNKIRMYQFEQNIVGKVKLYIVQDKKIDDTELNSIKESIDKKLKDIIDIEIEFVESVKLTNRGKYKKVIQNLK